MPQAIEVPRPPTVHLNGVRTREPGDKGRKDARNWQTEQKAMKMTRGQLRVRTLTRHAKNICVSRAMIDCQPWVRPQFSARDVAEHVPSWLGLKATEAVRCEIGMHCRADRELVLPVEKTEVGV